MTKEIATFAAGCFWGVELEFGKVPGVTSTRVGYTGGHLENPTYEKVCEDTTGHAEAVEVEFDPAVVSYQELLDKFWGMHDPTTRHRQGPDIGSQYRSAVFCHSESQKTQAEESLAREDASGRWANPVVTEILTAEKFWPAEEYHQKYLQKRGIDISCH
ncbi:peptide-methionine (S)-S-oxide reductase MsrA [Emcibacter nanhaiensis]|uniref:Peptide methionine sulfoxide reductase MsrA n=1 Tax=Emcibacter nanhaiensis TaxID=1505037 RepID=A0A501PP17_9PROT|nr:peptide-methionine (S)-S-oxide reductase MsrA [Emcibacter nanhaiensis]TPD61536.1 peptide-methionine (S)-S-oxide reductase MsrA [Emcibacter nanhaiensis]